MSASDIREELRRIRERDWETYYELHENDFRKITQEIGHLPSEKQLEALYDSLKKAYRLKRYAELNPQSPLNPKDLIAHLEEEIAKRAQNPSLLPIQTAATTTLSDKRLQHRWLLNPFGEIDRFKEFLKLFGTNGYFSKGCLVNARQIFDGNFASYYYEVRRDDYKIIWTATFREYRYFYFRLKEHDFFELNDDYGVFFESHMLFYDRKRKKVRRLLAREVTQRCRGEDPTEKKKEKIDYLFQLFLKSYQ